MKYLDASVTGESLLSDFNIYVDTGIIRETETKDAARIITHLNSGEDYYAVKMKSYSFGKPDRASMQAKWRELIGMPIFEYYRWPVDVIQMQYDYYLVYDIIPVGHLKSIAERSFERGFLGFDSPGIREITMNYIEALRRMAGKGYLFFGIDDDIIYTNPENNDILIPVYNSIFLGRKQKVQ